MFGQPDSFLWWETVTAVDAGYLWHCLIQHPCRQNEVGSDRTVGWTENLVELQDSRSCDQQDTVQLKANPQCCSQGTHLTNTVQLLHLSAGQWDQAHSPQICWWNKSFTKASAKFCTWKGINPCALHMHTDSCLIIIFFCHDKKPHKTFT